jgi:NAD+ kinase
MNAPRSVFVFANVRKRGSVDAARRVLARMEGAGVQVLLERDLGPELGRPGADFPESDLIMCLGGDGTMLAAVRRLQGRPTPILGVNLGGLGFLTAISSEELDRCVDAVLAGDYRIEERHLLKARTTEEKEGDLELHALNDIVVDEGTFSRRAVVLRLSVDGAYLGTFTSDGVIVATATGSTAYSLSAGGPIVQPGLPILLVTPICAHSLSVRPLVFHEEETLEVENLLPDVSLKVTSDGQDAHRIGPGRVIRIGRSERKVHLAFVGHRPFYEILRTKLNWGGIPKDR